MGNLPAAQQRALDDLNRTVGERRRYTDPHAGASVIRQFRRYLEREDAKEIGKALYQFLTLRIPGITAHYGLLKPVDGGFRTHYAEPIVLLADICAQRHLLERWIEGGDPNSVYHDGMNDLQILQEMLTLLASNAKRVAAAAAARKRRREQELEHARALAERHGHRVVPASAGGDEDAQPQAG